MCKTLDTQKDRSEREEERLKRAFIVISTKTSLTIAGFIHRNRDPWLTLGSGAGSEDPVNHQNNPKQKSCMCTETRGKMGSILYVPL